MISHQTKEPVIEIPDHIREMNGYVPGKTIAEVRRLYKPRMIAKLASNENRMGCSPAVQVAVQKVLDYAQDYPDPLSLDLRDDISRKFGFSAESVLVTAGSESAISILCRAFLQPGAEVVTVGATFVGFFVQAGVMNATVHRVPLKEGYRFDGPAMLDAINPNTKMVYLANPNNPTGTYMPAGEFEWWLSQIPEHVLVIVDEAYYEYAAAVDGYPKVAALIYGAGSAALGGAAALMYGAGSAALGGSAKAMGPAGSSGSLGSKETEGSAAPYRNVILLRTFSKAYGLAGFRIGYAVGDPSLMSQLTKVKLTFEPTSMAQAAARAALKDEDFLNESVDLVTQARERFYKFLEVREVEKEGVRHVESVSNSVMLEFQTAEEAGHFTHEMLKKGVILRQLTAFGLPHCVRVTMGTRPEMDYFEASFDAVWKQMRVAT